MRELYSRFSMRIGDTDVNKDGKLIAAEFDTLCEDVGSPPRRHIAGRRSTATSRGALPPARPCLT